MTFIIVLYWILTLTSAFLLIERRFSVLTWKMFSFTCTNNNLALTSKLRSEETCLVNFRFTRKVSSLLTTSELLEYIFSSFMIVVSGSWKNDCINAFIIIYRLAEIETLIDRIFNISKPQRHICWLAACVLWQLKNCPRLTQ